MCGQGRLESSLCIRTVSSESSSAAYCVKSGVTKNREVKPEISLAKARADFGICSFHVFRTRLERESRSPNSLHIGEPLVLVFIMEYIILIDIIDSRVSA